MKSYHNIACILVSIVLLFSLASCGSGENDASREEKIRALVKTSLDIQYEHITEDLDLVYTEEFYSNIPDYFYKDNLAPYTVYHDDFMTTLTETDDGELVVAVRVQDKQGSYIQVIHMIKNETTYLINNIEYDI